MSREDDHRSLEEIDDALLRDFVPHNDRIVVLLDPEDVRNRQTEGGLFIPEQAYDTVLRTGTVLLAGPGEWANKPLSNGRYQRKPMGVGVGERVTFIRFIAEDTHTSKHLQQILGNKVGLIQRDDILIAGDMPAGAIT